MDHGVVTDWDDMERIWHHLFMKVPLICLVRDKVPLICLVRDSDLHI